MLLPVGIQLAAFSALLVRNLRLARQRRVLLLLQQQQEKSETASVIS